MRQIYRLFGGPFFLLLLIRPFEGYDIDNQKSRWWTDWNFLVSCESSSQLQGRKEAYET